MILEDSIGVLKSVGEKRLAIFHKMGIYTVKDLLEYYPRDYDDRSQTKKIEELIPGQVNVMRMYIASAGELVRLKGRQIVRVKGKDETGALELVWFNQPYMKGAFQKGEEYYFIGKVTEKNGRLQMLSPDYEKVAAQGQISSGRIVPIYTGAKKLSTKMLRQYIFQALSETVGLIQDHLPSVLCSEYGLCGKAFAVFHIHFPKDDDHFLKARKRLAFEELLNLQLVYRLTKGLVEKRTAPFTFQDFSTGPIEDSLGFKLTHAQKKAVDEILKDLRKVHPMNRLVQGDVGCGKTAVAIVTAYVVIKNGYQVALMAPTEVLASQHYVYFQKLLSPLDIEVSYLSGMQKGTEKKDALLSVQTGRSKMVIGTHAVIQGKVVFHNLAMVITDEQHRFGVRQRNSLKEKGDNPHVLVMTATPIPRTLAMIVYGDLDITTIDSLPPGRREIATYAVNSTYRERVFDFILKELTKGRQGYVICPAIEEGKLKELQSVSAYMEMLAQYMPGITIGCLHGKMGAEEKNGIMAAFVSGKVQLIVATTVIEVGVNVPNATVILVENAERFGVAQLHQLRGRVGRGNHQSYCILLTDSVTKTAKERMAALVKTNDGFEISQMDLTIRGQGDMLGTRQHGLPMFKIADLSRDMDLLQMARDAAYSLSEPEAKEILEAGGLNHGLNNGFYDTL